MRTTIVLVSCLCVALVACGDHGTNRGDATVTSLETSDSSGATEGGTSSGAQSTTSGPVATIDSTDVSTLTSGSSVGVTGGLGSGGQPSSAADGSTTTTVESGAFESSSDSTHGATANSGSSNGATSSSNDIDSGSGCVLDCGESDEANDPLAALVASARERGLLLSERFSGQKLNFDSVGDLPGDGYKTACEWYGALSVAKLTNSAELLQALVEKFAPLNSDFVQAMTMGEEHVDRYIFGIVPLEIYLQTGDESYRDMGLEVADLQQTSNQTRDAIDDMFMMTSLQLQAYRASKDEKYIDFMSDIMVDYLAAQQDNGLFFHNVDQARVHWGRGNGWFAAGMAEMMRDLPERHSNYTTIDAGFKQMMAGLLPYQSASGLWYQVLDLPNDANNWEESSGTAMFAYAMVAGVRRGLLDPTTYVPAIERAWQGLATKISVEGDVSEICVGTWYESTAERYMALARLTGDGHGQAPVIWAAAELLR